MSSNGIFDHSGSTVDSFLEEENILQESEAVAVKRVLAWTLEQAMKEKNISKYAMARELGTSRSQVDRLLDPSHIGVSIGTITRAAMVVGKRVRFDIVNEAKHHARKIRSASPKNGNSRSSRHVRQAAAGGCSD
jgi:antitoxin HicB